MHAAKSHQQYPSIAVLELRRESTVDFSASPANVTRTLITILPACDQSDQSASPSRPRKARKAEGSAKKIRKKATRPIEYIQVPKHWFSDPLHQSMKTVVRPPTKVSRRKEISIDLKIPEPIFIDLMKPMDTGDMNGFEWEDEANLGKTKLMPTKDGKSFQEFKYMIMAPSKVDKFWRLEETEPVRRVRQEGKLVRRRRGLGSSRLHLSTAAETRGERTDLLAQVTGNVSVHLKVPKKERAMPMLHIGVKVSTLNKNGHIEWATSFAPRTAAALRKQMQQHLRTMVESDEYPTLSSNDEMLLGAPTESVRPAPLALMPPSTSA